MNGWRLGRAEPPLSGCRSFRHEMDRLHKKRAEASRRVAKIGWAAVAGLALIAGGVVMAVMKTHEPSRGHGDGETYLDDFLEDLKRLDLEDEAQLNLAKARIDKERKLWKCTRIEGDIEDLRSKINSSLQTIKERTRRESSTALRPK
jgi:hypothetical protein